MADKERLSNLKKRYQDEKGVAEYAGITFTKAETEWIIEQVGRVQELEGDLETLDSAIFRIGLTINNPNTSDDEKWDEINKLLSEAWERDCIH